MIPPLRDQQGSQTSEVTRILQSIDSGDAKAAEGLLPLVYDELHKLAAIRMSSESSDYTLQPTALVLRTELGLRAPHKTAIRIGRKKTVPNVALPELVLRI